MWSELSQALDRWCWLYLNEPGFQWPTFWHPHNKVADIWYLWVELREALRWKSSRIDPSFKRFYKTMDSFAAKAMCQSRRIEETSCLFCPDYGTKCPEERVGFSGITTLAKVLSTFSANNMNNFNKMEVGNNRKSRFMWSWIEKYRMRWKYLHKG